MPSLEGVPRRIRLSAELVEAFAGTFLSPLYDNPQPTPQLHRDCWSLYCSEAELGAVAAPREHAKSTALTHDYGLAAALFREEDYILIVSATEELAINHLGDIAKEVRENDDLIREFNIAGLGVDAKTEIIIKFTDGHECRFMAKGSGQKMRGLKWRGKRPGLIICDDLEEDEQVENIERRVKFRRWFYRALLPSRRRGGKVRVHGTILHEDALLARLMKSTTWKTRLFSAHKSFDDFSNILWPEQFPVSRLKMIRQTFIEDGDAGGYAQEYLNNPLDSSEAFLRKEEFLPMSLGDFECPKILAIGCDFAVSKRDAANRTSFTVGGKDDRNLIHITDERKGRWDTLEWIDVLFELQGEYNPEVFFVEDGVIWKSIYPTLRKEMQIRDMWLNCHPINPTKDKAARARPLQKRMRAGGMRFNKDSTWYEEYEYEMLRFTGSSDAILDDQFDSTAILVKGFELMAEVEVEDFDEEEEVEVKRFSQHINSGRSATTGY